MTDLSMTSDRWQQVKEILCDALEYSADERSSYLERACAADVELRAKVESLILAYEKSEGQSLFGLSAAFEAGHVIAPRWIGPYRLERELGAGGMGQVWLAQQTQPVRRQVAVKVIRTGFAQSDVLKRFLAERQSLALMNHPAIAKIFDAGATPDGQPYLVMEYVDGLPINEYCDSHALDIVQRLKLFSLVCEGVQHAHQRAIIHRDLKPSNILVKEVDGKPVPQIIDFGVAKELSGAIDGDAFMTQIGTLVGTPGYMSPEQMTPNSADVDTRTDVYSLGVILYELLIGALPLEPPKHPTLESLHRAFSEDARKPSTKLRLQLAEAIKAATNRATEISALLRQLRGDLDSIALKALERDRSRRYATPAELAADIGHYLRNELVAARAPSAGYRAGKYVRRHWAGVALLVLGITLLLGFGIAQSVQLRKTRFERDRADQIMGFMTKMFKVSDPSEARGNTVTAREVLDKSSQQIESGIGLDAGVQSDLLQVIAETYKNLGLYGRAHDLAQRSLDSRRQVLGEDDALTLDSMRQLGSILYLEGRTVEAETLLRRTLALQLHTLGATHRQTLETQNLMVDVLVSKGLYQDAERAARDLVAVENKTLGGEDPLTVESMMFLASALRHLSRFDEAERLLRQTLAIQQQVRGADHPDTLTIQITLSSMLEEQGHYPQAEALYRETLAAQQHVLGVDHPLTANTMTHLAIDLAHDRSRFTEAEALYRDALATEMRQVGPESRFTTRTEEGLANLLLAEGTHQAEAEKLFREVLRVRQKVLGPDNTDTLLTQYNLGDLLFEKGEYRSSEVVFRTTLEQQIRVLGVDHPDVLASKYMLAKTLLRQHQAQEAQSWAQQAFDAQMRVLGPQHSDTQSSLLVMTRAMTALGHYDEAKALYMSTMQKISKPDETQFAQVWYTFAAMAASSGHPDDALDALEHAIKAGYADVDYLSQDADLKSLQHDLRFSSLVLRMHRDAGLGAR